MGRLPTSLLLLGLSLAPLYLLSSSESQTSTLPDVGVHNPTLHIVPSAVGPSCKRIRVSGISRLNIKSYASILHLKVIASDSLIKRLLSKIQVQFHRNASSAICQFENAEWHSLQNGEWSTMVSPYENRFIDIKFRDVVHGSINITAKEEFQKWRLCFLGFGFVLLWLAPIVSTWVPFYYSTSMALGVLLVLLMILFQGMKLLPLGRKNILYLSLYGSLLGVGSFLAHYFSTLVNSILVNLGLGEEMQNPVSVFLLVGIILTGAALGYWIVWKFVISEDGNVDSSIAQFVKWAMRIIAAVSIFQSTPDVILAAAVMFVSSIICTSISPTKWKTLSKKQQGQTSNFNKWKRKARQAAATHRNIEFFSRSPQKRYGRASWDSSLTPWSSTPKKARAYVSPTKKVLQQQDYYSSFHSVPSNKFSKKEWEDFTRDSTREALSEWASTPEVADWLADNAHRMQLEPNTSSDMASSEDSSEETAVDNGSGLGLLKWY